MRWFCLFIALCACAPLKYVPLDYSGDLNNLEAFIEQDNITYAVRNIEITEDTYVFNLEINNQSNQILSIEADEIRSLHRENPFDESNIASLVQPPMTPREINRHYRRKAKNAQALEVFLFVAGAALVVNDVVQDSKDFNDENWDHNDQRKAFARDLITSAGLASIDVASSIVNDSKHRAYEELEYLPQELFLKQNIAPGELYYGKLIFPKSTVYKYLRIKIPVNNATLYFDFRKAKQGEIHP